MTNNKHLVSIMKNQIRVLKANGEAENFSFEKLIASLERAGATKAQIDIVVNRLSKEAYDRISTKKIYQLAFRFLKNTDRPVASRYRLKQAIMELGPTGYPFERYIGELLKYQGYFVEVAAIVEGACVRHEIDVIAQKGEEHFMIECKYHNEQSHHSDVKVPLYIHSRFLDVEKQWVKMPGHHTKFHQAWIVTNTRFTSDAIQYGLCAGINLISWDFPHRKGLKDMIDATGLHPLTCLTSMTKYQKKFLLENKIVLCRELAANEELLLRAGISREMISSVIAEAQLCSYSHL